MKVQNVIAVMAGVAGTWTYFAGVEQWKPSQMAAGLGIAAAGWAVKRIWETIAKRKAEEEERIARHKDEVFSIWMNCGAVCCLEVIKNGKRKIDSKKSRRNVPDLDGSRRNIPAGKPDELCICLRRLGRQAGKI